eukprot:SAG22_NODE_741_length_7507_cov_2.893224_5_plen_360_part_00
MPRPTGIRRTGICKLSFALVLRLVVLRQNVNANYAMLSSKVAAASGMGVLAVDYRTLNANSPKRFPIALDDVVDAFQWMQSYSPSSLHLYGDSSGGTQAVQLLTWMAHHTMSGTRDYGFEIASAVVFSAWLDLTASSPTYHCERSAKPLEVALPRASNIGLRTCLARRANLLTRLTRMLPSAARTHCTGNCEGIGDATTTMDPGSSRLHGMCAAVEYAGSTLPTNHPTLSPLSAPSSLLGRLPPLMLIIGGSEVLLGDNLQLAQRIAQAGGAVRLEVFEGMWHDFQMGSEGCFAGKALPEGNTAYRIAGEFLKGHGTHCHVACATPGGGGCTGAAPVKWHFRQNALPPPAGGDCPRGDW